MKILLTGAGGLLGSAFVAALAGHEVVSAGRERLDVRDHVGIRALVSEVAPDVVINSAAHTDLEAAERDPDPCFAANAVLPGLLAAASRGTGALLLHMSSTGCYGNWKTDAYTEDDEPQPTTVHHRAKIAGERAVRDSGCEHIILRTGWLFGGDIDQPKNFVWKRILEARAKERMTSDATQRGNPTFAPEVAAQALTLIKHGLRGTYNATSRGAASRFDYVARIVQAAGLPCKVEPGPAFQRQAAVSPNEVGRNYRLGLLGLDQMSDWETSVDRYVAALLQKSA